MYTNNNDNNNAFRSIIISEIYGLVQKCQICLNVKCGFDKDPGENSVGCFICF